MGEDAAQAEKLQQPGSNMRQEKPSNPSPAPSSTPSPSLNLGSTEDAIRDNSQVNAVTVLTLLDKLVNMLEAVQENQHKMEQRQISLEGSVKGIQNDLNKLSKYQASTSNTVSKLLEKSRKVSAHTRAVKERMEQQSAQVKRLESNHAQLLRRNHFKVLIFQEENEIPASVFAKEPASSALEGKEEPTAENKSLEETLHTVDLSSEDELPHDEDALEDSADEKLEESRAEKIKRSSLKKVDSLKKAFSRQNIEKKMNKLGTKIVSVERREKIKKSLTSNHQKISGKSSPFKVSPLSFGRKKVRDGESPTENETKSEDTAGSEQMLNDHEESSVAEGVSEASLVEEKGAEGEAEKGALHGRDSNVNLTIVEDEEEAALEYAQKTHYEDSYMQTPEETERSDEEAMQPAVLQVDQKA
ncbi:PREDICTED: serum deprivation-response protein [Elephantulus edwardii]|uniref:serum deprivation-response protein n=1 Tax=Elephantulus edwardii TaxID=28737 RepID=UPI0003F0A91B|nr:PREDICTED: serum deprivation-response protein [Elephantulus edwardii]